MYTPLYESKKITDLATLTSSSLAPQDLFPIVDISNKETKSITAQEIYNYFRMIVPVKSISSSYSDMALTASYTKYTSISASYAISSSYSNASSYSLTALTSSYSLNGGVGWYSLTITGSNSGSLPIVGMTPTGKALAQINNGDLTLYSVSCSSGSIDILLGGTVTTTTFDIKIDKLS